MGRGMSINVGLRHCPHCLLKDFETDSIAVLSGDEVDDHDDDNKCDYYDSGRHEFVLLRSANRQEAS